jgi:uracil-DNA glycosylase
MEQQGQIAASGMIESLDSWWKLAGVDGAVSESPVNWLELDTKIETASTALVTMASAAPNPGTIPATSAADWPSDIDTLKAMIATGTSLPGNNYGGRFVAPVGPASCEVMIVSDVPDPDELDNGSLGSGQTGALLGRMLRAIGITLADCYWTTLATTIPATGDIPDEALPDLADFVRHQAGLVKPKHVILFGSSACRALLGEELMKARAQLQKINQDGRTMSVLTTFHPRTLIARPAIKANVWKDLQMFAMRVDL